jgi:fructose transport system substrate-binding protein
MRGSGSVLGSAGLAAVLMLALGAGGAAAADKPIVGLVTKTNTNPFL